MNPPRGAKRVGRAKRFLLCQKVTSRYPSTVARMREGGTMASRRSGPPSPKSTSIELKSLEKSASSSKTAAKNNVVVCLVFFSILANIARAITGQIWHSLAGMEKRDLFWRMCKLLLPLSVLVAIPLLLLQEIPPNQIFQHLVIVWTALMHVSVWPVTAIASAVAVRHVVKHSSSDVAVRRKSLGLSVLLVVAGLAALLIAHCQIQIIYPSWIWSPFVWWNYKIYLPNDLSSALEGLCIDSAHENKHPLCLTESSWNKLSAGALSSHNTKHVQAVRKGLAHAQQDDGGLIINVMSRDTIDAIAPLQLNVEGLLPFFKHLSVVVFENDSSDGSREAFQQWAARAQGYAVDVMSCGDDNPDCKFGISHRYDATEANDYFKSSAIGNMADYRQKIVNHILSAPAYSKHYSHMMVIDLDLKISLSPLGVLHTLGTVPDVAVASSGRQVWPGSLGTIVPPYDFSAFRPLPTPKNQHLLDIHAWFCGLLPPGDRWRNQCDAASSIHLLFVLLHDWLLRDEPYPVASAFNGATLYPLQLIRETDAKYDVGDDGQRCEHIGFNLALQKPLYINPMWNFHILPTNPGGPTGTRSLKNVFRIVFMPRLSMVIFFQLMVFLVTFVVCCMAVTMAVTELVIKTRGTMKFKETELPLTYDDATRQKQVVDDYSLAKRHRVGKRMACS